MLMHKAVGSVLNTVKKKFKCVECWRMPRVGTGRKMNRNGKGEEGGLNELGRWRTGPRWDVWSSFIHRT